jgi:cytochrome c oxidase assembly protein subunit 11
MAKPHRKVLIVSILVIISMFGVCFALVPLYNSFCKVTGINTALRVHDFESLPDLNRNIVVEFIAINNANLPWDFHPLQNHIVVHPNQNTKIFFYAKNNSKHTMTIQAIPSYAPTNVAKYFHKIQCFCFEQQTLKPGAELEMPVVFRIDAQLPTDIRTITLAYTLFDVTAQTKTRKTL